MLEMQLLHVASPASPGGSVQGRSLPGCAQKPFQKKKSKNPKMCAQSSQFTTYLRHISTYLRHVFTYANSNSKLFRKVPCLILILLFDLEKQFGSLRFFTIMAYSCVKQLWITQTSWQLMFLFSWVIIWIFSESSISVISSLASLKR